MYRVIEQVGRLSIVEALEEGGTVSVVCTGNGWEIALPLHRVRLRHGNVLCVALMSRRICVRLTDEELQLLLRWVASEGNSPRKEAPQW